MIRDKSAGHNDRLRLLRLTTLETRRLRGDLIEVHVFKIFIRFEDVSQIYFFQLSQSGLHGHKYNCISNILNLIAENSSFPFVWLMCGVMKRCSISIFVV